MSTAGKVLTVLVTLSLLGWIFLASLVADLNANWGREIAALNQRIANLENDLKQTIDQVAVLQNQASIELVKKDADILKIRTQISKLEKAESMMKETLSRYQLQFASLEQAIEREKARNDFRIEEQKQTREELARTQEDIRNLQTETDRLFSRLDELRSAFQKTLEENVGLLKKYEGQRAALAPIRTARSN
jgi:chromosome segregation ATPase